MIVRASLSFPFAGNYCLEVVVFMFHTWAVCVCVFLLVICFNFFCLMLGFSLPMLLHVDLYFRVCIHKPQCVYLCLQICLLINFQFVISVLLYSVLLGTRLLLHMCIVFLGMYLLSNCSVKQG